MSSIAKNFGQVVALNNVDLEVRKGEFLVILGPSGCGKTTLLRCIAGLEEPSEGDIYFDAACMFSLRGGISIPPKDRRVGMVFQNYALYPHMTVFDNVAFGLKVRRVVKTVVRERVLNALQMVGLGGYEKRYPKELSGGQQQRVAVARTIAAEPNVLLFDEPLSNLDPILRISVRAQLKSLHRRLGVTSIYVTHDQAEAMILADRIVVMNRGLVEQVGTAYDIYHFPSTINVAAFTGNPKTNLIPGEVHVTSGETFFIPDVDPYSLIALAPECRALAGSQVTFHVRPEDIELVREPEEDIGHFTVMNIATEGSHTSVFLGLGEKSTPILARAERDFVRELRRDERVALRFLRGNVFDSQSGFLTSSFGYRQVTGAGRER